MGSEIILYVLATVFGLLGVILLFSMAMTKASKSDLKKFKGVSAIVLLIVGGFLFAWQMNAFGSIGLAPLSAGGVQVIENNPTIGTDALCGSISTSVTLSALDYYTGLATGGTHAYKVNGGPIKELANAGTFTASPNDRLEILWNNGSATNGYFSEISNEVVPCKSTDAISNQLYKNGTVTISVWNTDGDKINGVLVNQSLVAGDVKDIPVKLESTFQKAQPYGGTVLCTYNASNYDDCLFTGLTQVDVPSVYSAVSLFKAKAFAVPSLLSNGEINSKLHIVVKSSTDPLAVNSSALVLNYYPNNNFVKTGAFQLPSTQDSNDAQTIAYSSTGMVYVT
jgi:hypothetical protein